jgi:hypothetical protein
VNPALPLAALALLAACAPPEVANPVSTAATRPPIVAGSPAPGAPAVIGTFRPGAQPSGGGPVAPGGWAGDALFGGGPPDSAALGSASADGSLPDFSQPTGPRAQRFIRDLQF